MFDNRKYIVAIIIVTVAVAAIGYAEEPNKPKMVNPISVNELAANPAVHIGRISLIGVVGIVSAGKGFVLVDSREYKNCGLQCLIEPGTNKISFLWTGASPKLEQTVQVDGILEKTAKGFFLKAEKVTKQ